MEPLEGLLKGHSGYGGESGLSSGQGLKSRDDIGNLGHGAGERRWWLGSGSRGGASGE